MTDDELPLFAPRHNSTPTSIAAAARVAPHVGSQQAYILCKIGNRGPMTRGELVLATGLKENSVNGRCAELTDDRPGYHALLHGVGRRDGREILDLTEAGQRAYLHLKDQA